MPGRGTTTSGRGRATARVRELLRERERTTTAHVHTVVDARERISSLREQIDRLHTQAADGLRGLAGMGYTRAEIAALCEVTDADIPRQSRETSPRLRATRASGETTAG